MSDRKKEYGEQDDPVAALKSNLKKAVKSLKKLVKQQDNNLQDEMEELEEATASDSGQTPSPNTDQDDAELQGASQ